MNRKQKSRKVNKNNKNNKNKKQNNSLRISGKQKRVDRAKTKTESGTDLLSSIKVYSRKELDGGIKIVYSVDISPSSFIGSRVELLSNMYQQYKFTKFHVKFTSSLPTAIGGIFVAYIDTDPEDRSETLSKDKLLRLASGHQFAKHVSVNESWTVKMPIQNQDDLFYTGSIGDKRFRKQGRLYIVQVGACTNFEGQAIDEDLEVGLLEIDWTATFSNPQMQDLKRVYDGESQKNILRVFSNLATYVPVLVGLPTSTTVPGTRFRHLDIPVLPQWFTKGTGNYQLMMLPRRTSIPHSLKAVHSLAVPYSDSQYQKTMGDREYTDIEGDQATKAKNYTDYITEAFKLIKGGIAVAKEVYDVVTLVSRVFVAGTDVNVTSAKTIVVDGTPTSDNQLPAQGAVTIYWDGINTPIVEFMAEFEDNQHATAPIDSGFNLELEFLMFKLDTPLGDEPDVNVSIPTLTKPKPN